MMRTNHTALVVFTGDPRREERQKDLPPKFLKAVHDHLEDVISTVADVDLVIASVEGEQFVLAGPHATRRRESGPLAFQIDQSLQFCFASGYDRVILLAGDVIGLSGELLVHANASLLEQTPKAIIGPSPDGGFYLAGFNQYLVLDWDSILKIRERALASLRAELHEQVAETSLLPPVADIDSRGDAVRILSRNTVGILFAIRPVLIGLLHAFEPRTLSWSPDSFEPAFSSRMRAPPSVLL